MKKDELVARLLTLVDEVETAEKVVADTKFSLNQVKQHLACRRGEVVIGFDSKVVKNDDQREAILANVLKQEKKNLDEIMHQYDYAKLNLNRLEYEYRILLGVLWSDIENDQIKGWRFSR